MHGESNLTRAHPLQYHEASTDVLSYTSSWLIVLCVTSLMLVDMHDSPEWLGMIATALFVGTVALLLFVVYVQWCDDDDESSLDTVDDAREGLGGVRKSLRVASDRSGRSDRSDRSEPFRPAATSH